MVRKALLSDVPAMFDLIESYAKKGAMLHRPSSEIYDMIRDFSVYENGVGVCGVAALHVCSEDIAEIRSLAVKEGSTGKGVGTALLNACLAEAGSLGIKKVFALTYKTAFFVKRGFKEINKEVLPHKIWSDCIRCVKFPNCDEQAVIIDIK